ncbi:hypothetical protein GCM10022222_49160 [Amycolatopsis ultiminotia]|uniref:Uncharacterized protein n=1 Tax=Amycolatopsis ultiminotia TaxID=543629 RepID=A0ABP6X1V1_9PSEU
MSAAYAEMAAGRFAGGGAGREASPFVARGEDVDGVAGGVEVLEVEIGDFRKVAGWVGMCGGFIRVIGLAAISSSWRSQVCRAR